VVKRRKGDDGLSFELDTVVVGDCLDILPTIPDQSVDAVITDPPYPHIKRDYGYWTTAQWWEMIVEGVISEVRRILKPTGSAVFILQPNSEKVGKMRGWLWEFMAWVCREWNMVQDAWWWNTSALTTGLSTPRERGLMRASLKACVWCGGSDCYRDQEKALWLESHGNAYRRSIAKRFDRDETPSGQGSSNVARFATLQRGGVTPFNVFPIPRGGGDSQETNGHGGSTPPKLLDWWTRYIVPPGGLIVDPFIGSGTMAIAAIKNRCRFFGCDTVPEYIDIAKERIAKAQLEASQMLLPFEE
jgi:DNA modification methylase